MLPSEHLDATFLALADPTRRAILARLAEGEASVAELAEPFAISQPAISKHLKVLERARLISVGRDRQRRPRRLEARALADAQDWIAHYREVWEANFSRLDALLTDLQQAGATKEQEGENAMTTMPKAEVTLPSDSTVRVTRQFSAPRELVYRAYTEGPLMQRWCLGPPGWTMPVCEMDVRVGGAYRWRWRGDNDGKEFGFTGEFREVDPPRRIVHTQYYDPGDVGGDMGEGAIITVELAEADGVTTVTTLVDFGSRASRDAAMATGMTDGMELSYQNLDRLLAEQGAVAD